MNVIEEYKARLQLEKEYQDKLKRIQLKSIKAMLASILITLHDNHKWGKKRLNKLMQQAMKYYEDTDEGLIEIDDIIEWLKDYGVEL